MPVQASHTLYDPNRTKLPMILIDILSSAEKTPSERAQLIESTDLFTNIHAAAAASGQTAVPENLDTDLHFTCFVQAPNASTREAEVATGGRRLIELDGGRAGPVDRGMSTDLLKVRNHCLPGNSALYLDYVAGLIQDVAQYVREQIIPKAPSLEFSMIALAGGFSEARLVEHDQCIK